MSNLVYFPLAIIEAYLIFAVLYLCLLLVVYTLKNVVIPTNQIPQKHFGIIIPAHNEERVLGTLLSSLAQVDFPTTLYTTYVIADNCTDQTASIAKRHNADVVERRDEARRGKGYALAWAFDNIDLKNCDAVVVIDADCTVDKNFLRVMNNHLTANNRVIQALHGTLTAESQTPVSILLNVANWMESNFFYYPKSLMARASIFLQGTGMCFATDVLSKCRWNCFSIVEDLEYSIELLLSGETIRYTHETAVYPKEPRGYKAASRQKVRGASGVATIIRRYLLRLLVRGIRERRIQLIDAAGSLLLLNRSVLLAVGLAAIGLAIVAGTGKLLLLNIILFGCLAMYLWIGVMKWKGTSGESRVPIRNLPIYLLWACGIAMLGILGVRRHVWVRTSRES